MLDQVCQLARNAGDAIMQVYDGTKPMDVVSKADNSPVTAADIAAHTVIMDGLRTLTPDIPVLSEEDPPGWEVRQHWQRYWLVDPLDGTKEFIKRNGEFTVNIALIDHGKPILGVVYAPVMNVMYSAAEGKAWKEECGVRKQIQVRDARPPLVVISRSHADAELKEYLQQLGRTSDHVHRLFAEILPGGGRTGAAVPALRTNEYLGHRRWTCCGRSCRSARSRLAG
ncbi:cysQ protein [Escherichia coli]|uniref:3'(2'),5'-bisphosphate nucleotidase CysQ n=1 Tax=Escherichia coli TaxID=562 RepID=A0A376RQQ3_ECOLX|nr:cysQ protein [Escherichia coli]